VKKLIYLTLLIIAIPFFIVMTFIKEESKKALEEETTTEIIIKVKREATGKIEKVELEEYVVGVLAGEMPISFHIEALKAQAVASRSYVLKRYEDVKNINYTVVDTVTNQVYLDNQYLKERWKEKYQENILKLKRAVAETSYEYITYDDKIADALFFSTSNGFTENSEEIFSAEAPYLRSVESFWDEKTSPVFSEKKHYTISEVFNLLALSPTEDLNVKILKKSSTGRILVLTINGKEMKGSEVAKKLGLRSNDFKFIRDGNVITITTNGYGHGVGMSQYGALGMANEGYLYDEIIKHYYKGVEIKKIKNNK